MNSMPVYNKVDMIGYLKICHDYYKYSKPVPTRIVILLNCTAHTVHRVSRIISNTFSELLNIKTCQLECVWN